MQQKESRFDIRKTVRSSVPSLPYEKMARGILGPRYHLSLVVCGDTLARRINKQYRKKTYAANVLSFPLSKTEGEIFLNVRKAAREALPAGRQGAGQSRTQQRAIKNRMALLYVHGCFHLKGMKHGDAMERAEEKILKKFKLLG
jgi:rRNA maturation RNase YbeY